jgi:hypothetical protein
VPPGAPAELAALVVPDGPNGTCGCWDVGLEAWASARLVVGVTTARGGRAGMVEGATRL